MGMVASEIFDHYLTSLLETPNVWDLYSNATLWTKEATRSLVHAGLHAFPKGQSAAKGYKDSYQRSEYLTLDVCIDDLETWGPPLFIAEHENAPRRAKIQYCTWKLLATVTQRRVLVAYYDSKSDVRDLEKLEEAVREVCKRTTRAVTHPRTSCCSPPTTTRDPRPRRDSATPTSCESSG